MTRVVVAGMGDTGLQAAVSLARHPDLLEVVVVSTRPGLLSGRDLGTRLARPDAWARDYRIPFHRFRRLDRARKIHGRLVGLDLAARTVAVHLADGTSTDEPYDVLVLATGVRSGFARSPMVQGYAEVAADLRAAHARVVAASSLAVVGGGPTAVQSAAQVADAFPDKQVDLYFPGERGLTHHHERVWNRASRELERLGVGLHPHHRADLAPGAEASLIAGPVVFSTGQDPAEADLVLLAVGGARPNTEWLPGLLLDGAGFVRVDPQLRVPGHDGVWAVGDVAATDPLRTSARNRGAELLARNIVASLRGRPLRAYRPRRYRVGSALGTLDDGLLVFGPTGHSIRVSRRVQDNLLTPLAVKRASYGGVRAE